MEERHQKLEFVVRTRTLSVIVTSIEEVHLVGKRTRLKRADGYNIN